MMDQHRRLAEPLRWTRAGKLTVAGVAIGAALAVLALGLYAAAGGFSATAQTGCVQVTFASTTGAATLHACGSQARELCAAGGEHAQIANSLRRACRRAGYPFSDAAQAR